MDTFDIAVIGAGPGGYPAAIRAAQLGASVAIVEKEHLGGTCLNWGCIPTKALINAADLLARVKHAQALGINLQGASLDYATLIAHKDRTVGQMRKGIKQLLTGNGVKVLSGTASFRDRNTIQVGEATIGARKIIIATGSTSTKPAFLSKDARIVESRAFLDLKQLPATLIVLGGGFIGCELACLAAALGVKVTLIELLEDILLVLDPDVRREVRTHMETTLGIRILTGRAAQAVSADSQAIRCEAGTETLAAELFLCAVGRKPVTDGLKLDNAGLKTGEHGFIEADDYCRTTVANIFAIGDVTGKTQLAHFATAQGITAAENAHLRPQRKHETIVPNVIFTSPEIGTVGLTEEAATKQNRAVKVGKFRLSSLGKAIATAQTAGFAKWIADAGTDQLLGAAVVGAHATDLIAEAALAIRSELTVAELGRTIHAHPTFGELWMEAADAMHGKSIHGPPKRVPPQ